MGSAVDITTIDPTDFTAVSGIAQSGYDLASPLYANQIDVVGGRLEYTSSGVMTWNFYTSNQIRLWNPTDSQWEVIPCASGETFANTDSGLDGSGLVSGFNYDMFAQYRDGSGFDLVARKWSGDTTRLQTPARWQGVLCDDASTADGKSRRFLGTVRMGVSGATPVFEWSATKRLIGNYYNQPAVGLVLTYSTITSGGFDYDTGAWVYWESGVSGATSGQTMFEWLKCWENEYLTIPLRFLYEPDADGDRAAVRVKYNGTNTASLNVIANGADTAVAYGSLLALDRVGYNWSYIEQYGYTDNLLYQNITYWLRTRL